MWLIQFVVYSDILSSVASIFNSFVILEILTLSLSQKLPVLLKNFISTLLIRFSSDHFNIHVSLYNKNSVKFNFDTSDIKG